MEDLEKTVPTEGNQLRQDRTVSTDELLHTTSELAGLLKSSCLSIGV